MKIFVMVTTKSSERYTPHALRSFFATTDIASDDRFILIDNDSSYADSGEYSRYPFEVVVNQAPLGFASNMNQALARAHAQNADVVLLNNDVIFTPDWFPPSMCDPRAIVSPLSSREVRYSLGAFHATNPMELSDYIGNEHNLRVIAERHRTLQSGRMGVLVVPFFASYIPWAIIDAVGMLDEQFGRGGGEDYDYCLRAIERGFAVEFELSSYVLHFGGKSSWSGAESSDETSQREQHFLTYFQQKWGEKLFRVTMKEEVSIIESDPILSGHISQGDFAAVIAALK